jgi:hypothetical protein
MVSGGGLCVGRTRGQKRSNEAHPSTTDPDVRLYRKGPGMEARLCFIGHGLMENRSGLIVDARLTRVSGYANSRRIRKRIEEAFGWIKGVGGFVPDQAQGSGQGRLDIYLCGGRLQSGAAAEADRAMA